jgi:hypothetical protein
VGEPKRRSNLMMNDEGGEKERMQRFPYMPSTNFASLACINIPLLYKNSAFISSYYSSPFDVVYLSHVVTK